MSCEPNFIFSIDGHSLTVIEADGENTAPLVVDSLQIHAGQRYSVILKADQPVANYWIRAQPSPPTGIPGFDGGRNSAILRYAGAPASDPTTSMTPSVNPLREINLHALTNPAAPGKPYVGGADVVLNIKHAFDPALFKFVMNGHPWDPPSVPAFLQIMSGAKTAQELMPNGSYYALPRNKVIELSLPGTGADQGGPVSLLLVRICYGMLTAVDLSIHSIFMGYAFYI
jgi:iron transport multicopper oxidase